MLFPRNGHFGVRAVDGAAGLLHLELGLEDGLLGVTDPLLLLLGARVPEVLDDLLHVLALELVVLHHLPSDVVLLHPLALLQLVDPLLLLGRVHRLLGGLQIGRAHV